MLKHDLPGPDVTPYQAVLAIEGYLPAIEIGDMRAESFQRSQQMLLVCRAFNGGEALGSRLTAPEGLDLRLEGMVLSRNGEPCASATAVEVLGNPINAVVYLVNKLATLGHTLKAGMIVLTGSIVPNLVVQPGDHIHVGFTRLGEVNLRFTD